MKPASETLLALDTSVEAQQIQIALWRRMSALEKAQAVGHTSRRVQELSLAGIRQLYPSASERECRLRYALLTLGRTLALRAYPEGEGVFGPRAHDR